MAEGVRIDLSETGATAPERLFSLLCELCHRCHPTQMGGGKTEVYEEHRDLVICKIECEADKVIIK